MTLPPESATAMVQLYRGELGRMTTYRRRLDTTTNWAISAASAVGSLVLGSEAAPPAVALALLLTIFGFLMLEADRYRACAASSVRVRLLEHGFFAESLGETADPTWVAALREHLRNPRPPLGLWVAVGCRLRRTYLWIFTVTLVVWICKLELSGGRALDPAVLVGRAALALLPGWMVVAAVLAFYAWLVALALSARRQSSENDDW